MPRVAVLAALLVTLLLAVPAQAARTVALDAADAPHAFVVGTDGALYHAPPGGFLERLGGENLRQEAVAVVRDVSGRFNVFARGEDSVLYSSAESRSERRLVSMGTARHGSCRAAGRSPGS